MTVAHQTLPLNRSSHAVGIPTASPDFARWRCRRICEYLDILETYDSHTATAHRLWHAVDRVHDLIRASLVGDAIRAILKIEIEIARTGVRFRQVVSR